MKKKISLEKIDETKELKSLKEAFNSERLRWLLGHEIPELMEEGEYDELVEEVVMEEKIRSLVFEKAKELGIDVKEFIVYAMGGKVIMGIERKLVEEAIRDFKERGASAIKGVEILPDRLWLVL